MSQGHYPPPGGYGGPPGGGYGAPPGGPGGYNPPGWNPPVGGFAPMPANLPPGYTPDPGTAPLEGGVPWEQPGGSLVSKWWATLKACNFQGRPFFAAAAQNEKADAISFVIIGGAVWGAAIGLAYMIVSFAISAGLMIGMPSAFGGKGGGGAAATAAGFTIGIGLIYFVIYTIAWAVGAVALAFIFGGLHHVGLMLFGGIGQNKTFMHTVRVLCYAQGAAMPWIWIPVIGPIIAVIFGIVNTVVGYDETHRCGIGRALLVPMLPIVCCCGCFGLLTAMGVLGTMGP